MADQGSDRDRVGPDRVSVFRAKMGPSVYARSPAVRIALGDADL